MILNGGEPFLLGDNVIVFPDYAVAPQPPEEMIEGIVLRGNATGGSISLTGTVDDPEN